MKTFVYVADKANPANFEGVKVGWVEDSGDGTLELLVEVGGYKITTLCTVTIEQSGNTLIDISGDSYLVPCRLVTELFSAPEELEKGYRFKETNRSTFLRCPVSRVVHL